MADERRDLRLVVPTEYVLSSVVDSPTVVLLMAVAVLYLSRARDRLGGRAEVDDRLDADVVGTTRELRFQPWTEGTFRHDL